MNLPPYQEYPPAPPPSPIQQQSPQNSIMLPLPRKINQPQPFNWFPLYPPHHQNNSMREIHFAPNPTHIQIEPQGTTVEMRGDQILDTTLTPHPLPAQMDALIICSLDLEIGNIDYQEVFMPFAFFQSPPHLPKTTSSYCPKPLLLL